jgi:hypothetical protein
MPWSWAFREEEMMVKFSNEKFEGLPEVILLTASSST